MTSQDYTFVHTLRKLTSNTFDIVIPKYYIDSMQWNYKDSIKITKPTDNQLLLERVATHAPKEEEN